MKIGIDLRFLSNNFTGIGRYIFNLTKQIIRIDKDNKYYLIINNKLSEKILNLLKASNSDVIFTNISPVSVAQHFKINKLLSSLNLALYHYPQFDLPFFINSNIKVIVTLHDFTHFETRDYFAKVRQAKKLIAFYLTYHAIKRAEKIICVSENTKVLLLRYFPKINKNNIDVIYHGADSFYLEHSSSAPDIFQKFEIKKDKYILYVGVRRPHKNLSFLISAFSYIKQKLNDYKLVIAGNNKPYSSKEIELVNKLSLENDVIFTGFVEDLILKNLYKHAACLVSPSISEGFNIPILEAMVNHIPVLVSNLNVHKEIAGHAAIYFDPTDLNDLVLKLSNLLTDFKIKSELNKKAKLQVRKFSWETSANKMIKIYNSLYYR